MALAAHPVLGVGVCRRCSLLAEFGQKVTFAVARTLTVMAGSRLCGLVELLDKLHKRSRRRSRLVAMTPANVWLISCPDFGAIFCNRSTQLRQRRES